MKKGQEAIKRESAHAAKDKLQLEDVSAPASHPHLSLTVALCTGAAAAVIRRTGAWMRTERQLAGEPVATLDAVVGDETKHPPDCLAGSHRRHQPSVAAVEAETKKTCEWPMLGRGRKVVACRAISGALWLAASRWPRKQPMEA
jgi:hypothetical protein